MGINKRHLAAAGGLLALIVLFGAIWYGNRPAVSQGEKTVQVTVVHSDGSSAEFTLKTQEEYLGPALAAAKLVRGDEGPYGLYIVEADGETAVYEDNGAYWALYEGDAYAGQGVGETPVKDGGRYVLAYTLG